MFPSCFGILVEAISIASSSLQLRKSISLASFLQCPHFRSNRTEVFAKKLLLKILQTSQVFPVNFAKF